MKTRDEFLHDVFEKSDRVRAAEAAAALKRKKRMRVVMGTVSAAACLTLVVGFSGMTDRDFWTRGNDAASADPTTLQMQDGRPVWDDGDMIPDDGNPVPQNDDTAGKDDNAETQKKTELANGAELAEKDEKTGDDAEMNSEDKKQESIAYTSDADAAELWSSEALWDTNTRVRELSVALFKEAADAEKNSMISPTSILMAMALVENGAAGDTKKQMETTFDLRMSELNQWIRAWSAVQPKNDADAKSRMNLANAVWYNNSGALKLNENYRKTVFDMLHAEVQDGDFSDKTVKEINSWCSKNTYGMIDKIVEELSPAEQLVLLNAVAFEDQWSEPYKKSQVKKEDFTDQNGRKTKTSLMYSDEDTYCEDELAAGFIKPYAGGYQFVAILPKEDVTVADYMEKLDGERFAAFVNSGRHAVVHAVLPAFQSEYKTGALVKIFSKMGITDLFDASKANLSGIGSCSGQNLYVDDILHKTYIDVNREGTRAAAVTGIMVKTTALHPDPIREYTVRLDRPFIYAIVDSYTGTPVFMGTMVSAE